jgi:phospholipid transport system substrate-binding protein
VVRGLILFLILLPAVVFPSDLPVAGIVEKTYIIILSKLQDISTKKEAETFVKQQLLPLMDFDVASKLVLGKHWRRATPAQRKDFTAALQALLIKTYSKYLANEAVKGVQLKIVRTISKRGRAVVQTRLDTDAGKKIAVDYAFRQKNGQWKVYDIVVEGISTIKSFRSTYSPQIEAEGLEALIANLENKVRG